MSVNFHKTISPEDLKLYYNSNYQVKIGRRPNNLTQEENELELKLSEIHKKLVRKNINDRWRSKNDNKYKGKLSQLIRRNLHKLNEDQISYVKSIENKETAFKTLYKILHPDIY